MNDWNGNGSYDSADRYIDYKLSGGGSSGGSGGGGNKGSGSGLLIWFFLAMVVGAICEPIGVLIMVGIIGYLIFK